MIYWLLIHFNERVVSGGTKTKTQQEEVESRKRQN